MKESFFNFDGWADLAKSDPEAFEKKREEEIEKIIQSASPEMKNRLKSLQWRIDKERSLAKNPIDSMVRLRNMLYESVFKDNGFVDVLNQLAGNKPLQERKKAEVINLKK